MAVNPSLYISQQLARLSDRSAQAQQNAVRAIERGLQQRNANRRAQLSNQVQMARLRQQEKVADQKAILDAQKARAERLKNFQVQGRNTSEALDTALGELRKDPTPRGRFKVIKDLQGLQEQGVISPQLQLQMADVLTGDLDASLETQAQQFRSRFKERTDLTTEARQIAEGAGLDPDTMTREELLEHPDFVAERLRREALAERRAEKSAPRISVGDKSPLTAGATTQTQMWVRSARTELRNLKATTDLLNSPKGQKLFTVQSKFWNEPIARIKDALSASNPADKELLDTLQTAQQGARFGALAILNRFSGKQLTDNERKFTLKATGDPDSLTPTEIRTGLGLVQRKLARALLDDVDTLENKGLDLKAIRKESEEALGIPQGPKASKGLQGALERIKTAPATAREEYLKLKQSGASEEELAKFRAAAMEAIRNP